MAAPREVRERFAIEEVPVFQFEMVGVPGCYEEEELGQKGVEQFLEELVVVGACRCHKGFSFSCLEEGGFLVGASLL
jgi:hypothetical protein